MTHSHDNLLQQQMDYYRARASEYDEWFLRLGRYDHGPEWNARWFAEVEQVRQRLIAFNPTGDVLELACGTGWWTEQLAQHAAHLTAVDSSPEVLALNRERLRERSVEYIQADLFAWQPERQYDVVFFSFWLSHVPPERFDNFWNTVRAALKPGGRVFVVDSLPGERSSASNHAKPDPAASRQIRHLNDGRSFEIVKIFYEPADLAARLARLGWQIEVDATPTYFLYAAGGVTSNAQ